MEDADFVHSSDVDDAALLIDEACEAPVAAVTSAIESDPCSGRALAGVSILQHGDALADRQFALPNGFVAWLQFALAQELADSSAESALWAMEVILGEPGDDLHEALALAVEALQEHGASKAAEEVEFRWLLHSGTFGACQDDEAGVQPMLATVEAAKAPQVMEFLPRASDNAGVQDAKPARNHIADTQVGRQLAAPEAPEKRQRSRGGRSGFRRRYDVDHT